jgi:hypothetical protein
MPGYGVSRSGSFTQGEKAVGNATVQLVETSTPCAWVWVGAPTANHAGGVNTGVILVGVGPDTAGNQSGGRTIANNDYAGQVIVIDDASKLYLTGFNAGDTLEYQIGGVD